MCGIVGYVGQSNPVDFLLSGLKKLEYRGYDSSGIALQNNETIQIIKCTGKIIELEQKIKEIDTIRSRLGIAHTRWATHGEANERNAHPHKVGKVTIVHNGIIENASEIKNKLVNEGIVFVSETDTEIACAVFNYYYSGDPIEAITKAISELKGSYAFGILFEGNDHLYAVRKDSPLIVGIGENENYIASDILAISDYANQYYLLEDNEIADITPEDIKFYFEGEEITKESQKVPENVEDANKGKYKHFMLKEIMEEPLVLSRTINMYCHQPDKIFDLTPYEEVHIVACGSALYAGMIGKCLLEEKANIKCICECASEYRYKKVIYDKKTLVILVSQSGETADTVAAMRKAHEEGVDTLAIVNVKTSTIARESHYQMFIEAGPEIAVATTKAYLLQVFLFSLLALHAASKKGLEDHFEEELTNAKKLPSLVQKVLKDSATFKEAANDIKDAHDVFFIGRGVDYAISCEGSLKLKEVSYTHSDAYQAGELKHGTISLVEEGVPVFVINSNEKTIEKTESNAVEVETRKAKVFQIKNYEGGVEHHWNYIVPKISDYYQPIVIVPALQLIAYYVGDLRGLEIDKPRNLAKSVTVE